MKRFPVQSSQLKSVGHEPRTGLMEVEFHHGGRYLYGNVPEEKFKQMLMADSIGSYFSKHIKGNKNHSVTKLPEEEKPQS